MDLITPVHKPYTITQRFNTNWVFNRSVRHGGIDYAQPDGMPVFAAAEGKIKRSEQRKDYGHMVEIDHGGGWTTLYAHFDDPLDNMKVGDYVDESTILNEIGDVSTGETGYSTGDHLHFELRRFGIKVDPEPRIKYTREEYMSRLERLESLFSEYVVDVETKEPGHHEKNLSVLNELTGQLKKNKWGAVRVPKEILSAVKKTALKKSYLDKNG